MSNPWIVLLVTVGIIALSAFFVILEFSLMGARRYRLEQKAEDSRSARAALRGVNELTTMLAGAQLGITVCTFALGAVTKPAFDAALSSLFAAMGLPTWLTTSGSFVIALLIVTFLHLVVGEMAPKSWALSHPERAAMATGIFGRAFVWLFGPLLRWVNNIANRLVTASGVEPVDRAAVGGRDAATIRRLVEHSAQVGALESTLETSISGALELEDLKVEDLIPPSQEIAEVASTATVEDVQAAALNSRHLRIIVRTAGAAPSVIHVRDTLLEPADRTIGDLARPALTIPAGTPVHQALNKMQKAGEQLAVVLNGAEFLGIITVNDASRRLLPQGSSAEG